jgi:hypothetical protein
MKTLWVVVLFCAGGVAAWAEAPYVVAWSRQLGTSSNEYSHSVAVDGTGGVYIGGWTNGSLGGPSVGSSDAFLAKYDASGVLEWCRQIGTSVYDSSHSVAADGAGGVYISGTTAGSLDGPNAGSYDAFLAKYDTLGVLEWSRQIGTSAYDCSLSVAADGAGGVYINGWTYGSLAGPNAGEHDAFLAKYVIPEPATLSLLAVGGLLLIRRRGA